MFQGWLVFNPDQDYLLFAVIFCRNIHWTPNSLYDKGPNFLAAYSKQVGIICALFCVFTLNLGPWAMMREVLRIARRLSYRMAFFDSLSRLECSDLIP